MANIIQKASRRKSKAAPQYYFIYPDYRGLPVAAELLNPDLYIPPPQKTFVPPGYPSRRGLPTFPSVPKLLIEPNGQYKAPRDFQQFSYFYLVSEKMRSLLLDIAKDAIQFAPCKTRLNGNVEGPMYWFCDILPIVEDALDMNKSRTQLVVEGDYRKFEIRTCTIQIDSEKTRGLHLFRIDFGFLPVADQLFVNECKKRGIRGISFKKTNADLQMQRC